MGAPATHIYMMRGPLRLDNSEDCQGSRGRIARTCSLHPNPARCQLLVAPLFYLSKRTTNRAHE